MKNSTIGFVGSGNMATALVKGLVESGLYSSDRLLASDSDPQKLKELTEKFGIKGYSSNRELVGGCTIIVLAVKPQVIREVLEEVRDGIRGDHLVISIAAGIPMAMIHSIVGSHIPLIRVMPNTPALIQKGISALAPGELVTPEQMKVAEEIFNAVGETVVVEEEMMDSVTAMSGSGPGYIFRIMEALVEAGEKLGFDRETATRLVVQTTLGAAHLAKESEKSLPQLREMVTSPGGTTAAALDVFERMGLGKVIQGGVEAARKRGAELGKNY